MHNSYDPGRFAPLGSVEGAEAFYASQADQVDVVLLVAEIDNRVVGFAYMQFERINYADLLENALRVHDLYVDEMARGSGAGRELLNASREAAREFGADKMVLSVAAENEPAQAFFSHEGFRQTMIEMTVNLKDPGSGV